MVPASLKYQWLREIRKFTDCRDSDIVVIDGTPTQRDRLYARVHEEVPRYVILNYETVRNDYSIVAKLPHDYLIFDEITRCKTARAKTSKSVKRLSKGCPYVVGLTGQPVENRPEDLFSIMGVIDPSVLGPWDLFERYFIVRDHWGRVLRVKNLPHLRELLSDAMVRKTYHDPDVAPYMPKVEQALMPVQFDTATASLYRRIATDLSFDLQQALASGSGFDLWRIYAGDSDANEMRGQIMSKLTALRMLCDHPELLRTSAKKYRDERTDEGSKYAAELDEMGALDGLGATPKMRATTELLHDILMEDPDNKVVIFSTFVDTLGYLATAMADYGSVQFHGKMDAKRKDEAKTTFQTDPRCRLFLSSDAGGYGLDLPNANYLINFDLPWSSGKYEQRCARIIRLSSEWGSVVVLDVVMEGSIEERQYTLLESRRALAAAMVDGLGVDIKGRLTLDVETLSDFLAEERI